MEILEQKLKSPLTDSQMGIYLECIMSPESSMYNIPLHFIIQKSEKLTLSMIADSVDTVIKSHPALYSHIKQEGDSVFMVREDYPSDGLCITEEACESDIGKLMTDSDYVFDLENGPLCICRIVLTEDKVHIFLLCHHIVFDGTSLSIFCRQFADALDGKVIEPENVDSFSLFELQTEYKKTIGEEDALKHFESFLSGVEIDSNLIADYKAENTNRHPLARFVKKIDIQDLKYYLKEKGLSESTLFMGAYGYTLAKMTGQNESLFAVGESGRKDKTTANTVSMMVKTLPVVTCFDETQPVFDSLNNLQTQFYASLKNDVVPFEKLNKQFGVNADVMFVYQGQFLSGFNTSYGFVSTDLMKTKDSITNIATHVNKLSDGYYVLIEYRSDLYKESTIARFADLYAKVATAFAENKVPGSISLISDRQKEILDSFNETSDSYYSSETVLDMFSKSVNRYPDKTVITFKNTSYSYKEVDDLSNRIASFLIDKGIGKGDFVPILIKRSAHMLISALGVMKSGAAYEPMDPSYPTDRLQFMYTDSNAKIIIADETLLNLVPDFKGDILGITELDSLPMASKAASPDLDSPFVLLYTSGTTGNPKGVRLNHRNLSALINIHKHTLELDESSRIANYASFGFDAHIPDLYPVITCGGQILIIPDEIRLDFPSIKNFLDENIITHLFMTTQVAHEFVTTYNNIKTLRFLSTGGEKLVSFTPSCNYKILNLYGPTEATVYVTRFCVDKLYNNIPIGSAVENCHIFIVDSLGRRVPVGVPGELVICGPQVSNGYLNREDQTAKVFVENIYEDKHKTEYNRCYKTGDVVRYLEDGNIEFIGRRDQQVKIRGFRIELEEVEKVIREYPKVKSATVIAVDTASGKNLHAYIVSDGSIDFVQLSHFIRERKPAYMVPSAFMQIDNIPLTPNHKVDKRKLPPITNNTSQKDSSSSRSLTHLEKEIFDIVSCITDQKDFDVDTDLSFAGITSITSIKLAFALYEKFNVNITSKDILDGGTVLSIENLIVETLLNNQGSSGSDTDDGLNKNDKLLSAYPLTQTQMGIYLECLRIGTDAYNIPMLYELPECIDIDKLKSAVKKAVRAHASMLCYVYSNESGDVAMYPDLNMDIEIKEEIIDCLPPVQTHFDFVKKPLFCFRIINCNGKKYLFVECHHIIFDGESSGILMNDISNAYSGKALQTEAYTSYDLSLDEQKARSLSSFNESVEYYDSVFRGVSADYMPCTDKNDKSQYENVSYDFKLSYDSVKDFCNKVKITENVFFTGVFAMLVAKFTAHEDALFTTIYNGRSDARTANTVSMLVKTLPVYVQINSDCDVITYFKNIENNLKLLRKHDIFSFAEVSRKYGISAQLMFIYQGNILSSAKLEGNELNLVDVKNNSAKSMLSFELFKNSSFYSLVCDYDIGKYSKQFMDSFADAFETCAESFIKSNTLKEIEILSKNEFERFADFNDTEWDIPYRPAYRLVEEKVDLHPDKTAVISGDKKISYIELDKLANITANRLIEFGIKTDSAVAIMTDRTADVYIAEFGILKSGGAFIFLSPSYPDQRIKFIADDAKVSAVVTTRLFVSSRKELFDELNLPVVYVDDIEISDETQCDSERPSVYVEPDALSYMIYTSGSTGTPKGVMVTQKGFVNLIDNNPKNHSIRSYASDISAAASAFTFDASILDGIGGLAMGMTVCIASDDEIHNPDKFTAMCLKNNVQCMVGTPSLFLSLLEYPDFGNVVKQFHAIIAGGEVFTSSLYEKLRSYNPNLNIINGYGPSETSVECTAKILCGESITIGKPLCNTKIYILDKCNHILPMGALGELTIVGDGVGRGYINREDLTKRNFIEINGKRAYKSGDLSLITHSEEIEFHGRLDNQVKIRGLRVELGEIESAINACNGVKNCIVTVNGDERNRYLAGYYTCENYISPQEIKAEISKTLTEYMVPRILIHLDEMPVTANGKIDKRALPAPVIQAVEKEYVAPRTDMEIKLCEAFEEALGLEKVGVTDDFFEMGGTSLTATKVAMFALANNINIAYKDVFTNPTVKQLCALCGVSDAKSQCDSVRDDFTKEDYSDTEKALSNNVWSAGDDAGYRSLGNILLTGPTGFLGMHILHYFLKNEDGDVYCLLRKGSFSSAQLKLLSLYIYYFDESIESLIDSRIHCIDGDIVDSNLIMSFKDIPFDTVINCAACVKHFSNDDVLQKTNAEGVKNLVNLCLETGKRLIHVSTISVAGEGINNVPERGKLLHESELFFGQTLDNQYIISKFKAEKIVLDAVAHGLDAKIMRAGNLMPRFSDGEFQINHLTNGFMRRLRGYYALGCIPYSQLSGEMEFSPIDETAGAMLALAKTDRRFSVFHANNIHTVYMCDVIRSMNEAGLKVECVTENEFADRLKKALENTDTNSSVSGLIAYMNRDMVADRYMLGYCNAFSCSVLNRIGYDWNITDIAYIKNALEQLKEFGFFDIDL